MYLVFLTMTKYHIPPPSRCRLPEGWSPGPTKRVIRPDDALLTSLLDFSEGEEVVFLSIVLLSCDCFFFCHKCSRVLLLLLNFAVSANVYLSVYILILSGISLYNLKPCNLWQWLYYVEMHQENKSTIIKIYIMWFINFFIISNITMLP